MIAAAYSRSANRLVVAPRRWPGRMVGLRLVFCTLFVFSPLSLGPVFTAEAAAVAQAVAGAPSMPRNPARGDAQGETVAALVDGQPIFTREVERLVRQAAGGAGEVNPAALPLLKAQALDELVKRRLVLAYARQTGSGPSAAEVEAALAEMQTALKAQGRALEDWLAAEGLDAEELRGELRWKLTWEKYLARYLTDQRRCAYFEAHRRELDGTEVVVSQILLRPPDDAGPEAIEQLAAQAEALRGRILAGELSFAEAARRYSAAPSAQAGGKLGPIRRHGAMVEAFARAAFALEPGQLSPPVRTQFGVHLIRCDGVEPGGKQWTEVRDEIDRCLKRELLERLAQFQAARTAPQYTGRVPYLKPGTRELVVP